MKFGSKVALTGLMALTLAVTSSSAFATGEVLKACKSELKKHKCSAKTDQAAHECLEKHEAHGKKDDGFSHGCYEAHEAYEAKAGGEAHEEKGETHPDEPKEHQE